MRLIREVTAEEERFRTEISYGVRVIRRDPVEVESIGTIILVPMRVMGYDRDCDGSLIARLEQLDLTDLDTELDGELLACTTSGDFERYPGCTSRHGLYPTTGIVATPAEIRALVGINDEQGESE